MLSTTGLSHGYERVRRKVMNVALGTPIAPAYTRLHPCYVADAFAINWVDPATIEWISPLKPVRLYGRVKPGDWDIDQTERFDEKPVYRALEAYLLEGEEEPYRKHFNARVPEWGHKSTNTFDERLEEIDSLVESLRTRGYRAQRELAETSDGNNEVVPDELNEVTVDLNRNGEPMWNGYGAHRLSLAKLLNIEVIPVVIATRHQGVTEPSNRFAHEILTKLR